ncbi:hypothetical protein BH10CHL1_BH10CHL1_24440 [soil metagenome]
MIALQQPELIVRVQNIARAINQDENEVLETAVQLYLDHVEREKIHAETQAFWAMTTDLQSKYLGEFVAVHEGQVIDHDLDVAQLEQRITQRLGDIAVLIAPVTQATQRDLYTSSFRLEAFNE